MALHRLVIRTDIELCTDDRSTEMATTKGFKLGHCECTPSSSMTVQDAGAILLRLDVTKIFDVTKKSK